MRESNEKKRMEAEKKRMEAEKQRNREPRRPAQKSMQAEVPCGTKELSEPLKTLEFIKDLLTEKVERVYFHVFP